MSKLRYSDTALSVGAIGTNVTTSATSQNIAIPTDSAGIRARFVRIEAPAGCYIKFVSGAGVACTANDIQVAANYPEIYDCKAFDHINVLQLTSATTLSIIPLES